MAAWVFFGIELDEFQAFRMRMMWFVPLTYDSSGIGTAKTELIFLWACLRMILLKKPQGMRPRRMAIFYQTLGAAENIFYNERFRHYVDVDAAKLFRRELRPMHGGKLAYRKTPDSIQLWFRNRGMIELPAVNLQNDSSTMAGRRYDDGATDEAPEFDAKSGSLDRQLLGRINMESFNPGHPLWANHKKLNGHAQDPDSHPFYKRIKAAKRQIWDGDPDVALITSSFRDWSPPFAKRFRKDHEIRTDRLQMTRALFLQIREGLWANGTEDWYDAEQRKKLLTSAIVPEIGRLQENATYSLGWDTALGQNKKSDWNAGVILRATPASPFSLGRPGVFMAGDRCWHIAPVWATGFQQGDHARCAGIIHRCHQRFGLAVAVLDPGGGGLAVNSELSKSFQMIDNTVQKVTGLCTPENAGIYPEALPLVRLFGRSEPDLQHVWGDPKYRLSDEGPIHAIHVICRNMIESRCLLWPQLMEDRLPAQVATWEKERRDAQAALDNVFHQLGNIRVAMGSDGNRKLTSKGFLAFESKGKRKKDFAYAFIYALVGLLSKLMDPDWDGEGAGDGEIAF